MKSNRQLAACRRHEANGIVASELARIAHRERCLHESALSLCKAGGYTYDRARKLVPEVLAGLKKIRGSERGAA